ncbi:hypothetical protein [Pseudoduganella sp. GCM10020061]|uniref:hypothetical protein n=1 Tax=Pseudoduganella sp. GCM10020061 TaxID=3317345 RepID=UPI00362A4A29
MLKLRIIATLALLGAAGCVLAGLPPPTPEQVAAQAAKKAQADAEAAEAKRLLGLSMDSVAARWRRQAAAQGWRMHPPTALPPPPAPAAPLVVQSPVPVMVGGSAAGTVPARPETIATGAMPAPATAAEGGVNRQKQQQAQPQPGATGKPGAAQGAAPAATPRAATGSAQRPPVANQATGQAGPATAAGRSGTAGAQATGSAAARPSGAATTTTRPAAAAPGATPTTTRPAATAAGAAAANKTQQEGRR